MGMTGVFSRSVAVAAMVVAACVSARAMTITSPTGDWIVGPITAKSSSGVAYCSMKNDYDSGLSLVFARDAEGANSIAIDFHKKQLEIGAQYQVGFQVGLIKRQMVAIAATPSVLIVQMGLDSAYYETLRRKSVMHISLSSGEDMAFALNGTSDALTALTECAVAEGRGKKFTPVRIAAGKMPQSKLADGMADVLPPQTQQPPAQIYTSEKAAPTQDYDLGRQAVTATLQNEIDKLKAENRALLLQNQAIAARMAAEDAAAARHPAGGVELPQEVIHMPPKEARATPVVPALEDIHVKTSSSARKSGKTHVISASLTPVGEDAAVASAESSAPAVEPAAGAVAVVKPDGFLKDVLHRAGIRAQKSGQGRYTWKTQGVYGGALEGALPAGTQFTAAVDNYLLQAKARCKGDFAHKTGAAETVGGLPVQTGEVACIDGKHDVGAALLFVQDGKSMIVITHEGTTDQMETALGRRAAVLTALSQ